MSVSGSRIKRVVTYSGEAGGVIGGITAFFGDFLMPLAPVGIYVAGGTLSLLLIFWGVHVLVPKDKILAFLGKNEDDGDNSIWFAPLAGALIVLTIVSFSSYKFSSGYGDEGSGAMASVVPEIRELQKAVGVLESIDDHMEEMVKEQQGTNQRLDTSIAVETEIVSNTEKANELQGITNKGVFWNQQTLQDALVRGDIETLEMFRNAGHDLSQVNYPSSSAPLAEAMILYAVRSDHVNINKTLAYLHKHGFLDLERVFKVATAMNPYLNVLWQRQNVSKLAREFIEKGVTFKNFQTAMKKKGYVIPGRLESDYKSTGGFAAGPAMTRTTLLIESIYAENKKASKYLYDMTDDINGYIELTNGVRIILTPELAQQSVDNS